MLLHTKLLVLSLALHVGYSSVIKLQSNVRSLRYGEDEHRHIKDILSGHRSRRSLVGRLFSYPTGGANGRNIGRC